MKKIFEFFRCLDDGSRNTYWGNSSHRVTSKTREKNINRRLHLALALLVALTIAPAGAFAAVISDDFESDTAGLFPSGWLDVGQVDPASTAPDPSATVVSTTDAFGNPTNALAITDAFATSQGIYQPITMSPSVNISVDVRVDRFSDNQNTFPASDWAIDITLSQIQGQTDLAFVPSMGIYASSATGSWHGWIIGTDGAFYFPDLGLGVDLNTWYRVELDLDTVNGIMDTRITDIATGTLLLDRVDTIPGWTSLDGLFDAVAFFDGELTAENVTNLAVIDNISINFANVDIDIKPGSDPNSINLNSKGVIPVAILTTEDFDATTVDFLSVAFGPDKAKEAHGKGHFEDADGDGDLDLILHFKTQETGIACGDTEAGLTGETSDGQAIAGFDSVNIVRCD